MWGKFPNPFVFETDYDYVWHNYVGTIIQRNWMAWGRRRLLKAFIYFWGRRIINWVIVWSLFSNKDMVFRVIDQNIHFFHNLWIYKLIRPPNRLSINTFRPSGGGGTTGMRSTDCCSRQTFVIILKHDLFLMNTPRPSVGNHRGGKFCLSLQPH